MMARIIHPGSSPSSSSSLKRENRERIRSGSREFYTDPHTIHVYLKVVKIGEFNKCLQSLFGISCVVDQMLTVTSKNNAQFQRASSAPLISSYSLATL